MTDIRIVHNEGRDLYRIERRGWLGWAFVMDPGGRDYATFGSYEAALRFACRFCAGRRQRTRRWQVVDWCRCRCRPSDRVSG